MHSSGFDLGGGGGGDLLVARRTMGDDAEFDITAMIDLVFLMTIYFMVTFLTAAMGEINLPTAAHVAALDPDTSVAVTVMGSLDGKSISVFLANSDSGESINDAEQQEKSVREYVEQAQADGKTDVLIKAERKVRLRDLFRVSTAAAVEGMKLHVAVTEGDPPS